MTVNTSVHSASGKAKIRRHGSWKRRAIYVLGLGIVATLIVMSFRPIPVAVTLAQVNTGPLSVTVQEDGITRIKEKYVVSAPLSGRLRRVQVHAGDPVVQGETLLAVLDPQPPALLDARSRAEAEARVAAADTQRHVADPQVAQAKAAAQVAEEELRRAEELFQRKSLSHELYDRAQLDARLASERLRAAEFAKLVADHELELARAALIHTQRDPDSAANQADEWRIEIRSPVNGRILRVQQESAATLSAGQSILEIGDPQDLEIVVDVLSSDAIRIRTGQSVRLINWGGDTPIAARVRLVEPSGFTKISALGVEEQRVNVIMDLTEPGADLKRLGDGFRVDAQIEVDHADKVVQVPNAALFRIGDEQAVFVVAHGRAQLRSVRTGRRSEGMTEVLDGLRPGETVVVYPSDKVADGVVVSDDGRS